MKISPKKIGIKNKLIILYVVIFGIMIALVFSFTIEFTKDAVYANRLSMVENMTDKACNNFDRKIEQYEYIIAMAAYNEDFQKIYRNNLSLYQMYKGLDGTLLSFYSNVLAIYLDDIENICVYSTSGLNKWRGFIDSYIKVESEEWFQTAIQNHGIHWTIENDIVFATCRIDDLLNIYNETQLGVLYMSVNGEMLFDDYAHIDWPAYKLTIYSATSDVLLQKSYGDYNEDLNIVDFIINPQNTDWSLKYSVPKSTLYIDENMALPMNLCIVACGMIILLLVMVIFTNQLLSGLKSLKQNMQHVENGELQILTSCTSQDEIGELSNTFNHMLERIRELLKRTRENERRLANMEIEVLRAQIDPHFLYNTLSFINWKCVRAGQEDVSDIINQLAMFYRTCLNMGNQFIYVRTEIANIEAYINIQLRLHDNNFCVEYDLDEELLNYRMLSFVLQPLIENAILHGLDKRRDADRKLILVLRRENEKLVFYVRDNGPGLTKEKAAWLTARDLTEKFGASSKGYGIRNVQERIALQHGEGYGIRLGSWPGGGCEAVLVLPLLE